MRVLILGDTFAESAQRLALERLLPLLDSLRIQAAVAALRAAADGKLIDSGLGARRSIAFGAVGRLLALLRGLQIELLHIVEPAAALVGILAARRADLPVSIVCEKAARRRELTPFAYLLRQRQWRLLARHTQRILTPSELVKRDLIALANVPPEKIGVVYTAYPLPIEAYSDRVAFGLEGGKNIALILPAAYDSGYLQALEVLERLLQRQLEVRLVIIGDGETFHALRQATTRHALPIRWFPNRAEVYEVLAACDAVLDCTIHEGLPEGLIAAMLAGKPIVAPRQVGITEVLEPNVAALIVTPGDISDMALQMSRLLQYDSLAERLGRNAHKRGMERFSPQAHSHAMIEFFEAAIYSLR
ncbi:MAG: glycosyltransferase [Chloroflexi bacterium CFX4]|nr:glycosyltransferase [Chloroflexi bacterium CFX4]MDL1923193.1 glycosyltransferase family 4 protein [Chloroflexi bacterium CFX3]